MFEKLPFFSPKLSLESDKRAQESKTSQQRSVGRKGLPFSSEPISSCTLALAQRKEWIAKSGREAAGLGMKERGKTGGLHFDYSDWGCHIAMNI